MSRRAWGFAAVGLVLAAVWTADGGPAPAETPGSVREAVYFSPAGPVRVRLHVMIGERTADAAWEKAVGALFAFLDRNGDRVLDATERAAVTAPQRARDAELAAPDGSAAPLRLTFARKDEAVTRAAFAAAVRAAGFEPVRLSAVAGRADSAQLSAALFRHLDRDKDGKLSADELRAAREVLAPLDVNEDELLTAAELLGRSIQPNPGRPAVVAGSARMPEESTASLPDLLFLSTDGTPVVKQILAARGGVRATSLRRSELGMDAAAFAALDKDGNGRLDTAELAAWLRRAPEVELALTLAPGRLSLLPGEPGRHSTFRQQPDGAVIGSTPGTQFRFEVAHNSAGKTAGDATADRMRQQFLGLAKGQGFVTRKQLENQPAALAFFDFADRNADGKVDRAEVEAGLKVLAVLAACRVEIPFVDGGNGLFEVLDSNGDGQLSPRELIEAAAVLRPFADASGRVGPRDLPRKLRIQATLAGIPAVVAPPPVPEMARRASAQPTAGEPVPEWFSKMDRNGDGEVSLREFLGPLELFHKLDRNGDGLISPAEARAAGR
jgi:Ca2+-binding EF-hand superfamily protein